MQKLCNINKSTPQGYTVPALKFYARVLGRDALCGYRAVVFGVRHLQLWTVVQTSKQYYSAVFCTTFLTAAHPNLSKTNDGMHITKCRLTKEVLNYAWIKHVNYFLVFAL